MEPVYDTGSMFFSLLGHANYIYCGFAILGVEKFHPFPNVPLTIRVRVSVALYLYCGSPRKALLFSISFVVSSASRRTPYPNVTQSHSNGTLVSLLV